MPACPFGHEGFSTHRGCICKCEYCLNRGEEARHESNRLVFSRMKREIDLTEEQVREIIALAKKENTRDYLIFRLMPFFRVGEVMGSEPRKWDKSLKKWFPVEPTLPGLLIQDLHDDGIWVQGKGWKRKENPSPPIFMAFSPELVKELRDFIGNRKTGRIF